MAQEVQEHYGRSLEDYLKAILVLERENGSVLSVHVSRRLNVTKPSVTFAVRSMIEKGLLVKDEKRRLWLTAAGRAAAERVDQRHAVLSAFLKSIGVSPETADRDACEIEHVISEETFERLVDSCG